MSVYKIVIHLIIVTVVVWNALQGSDWNVSGLQLQRNDRTLAKNITQMCVLNVKLYISRCFQKFNLKDYHGKEMTTSEFSDDYYQKMSMMIYDTRISGLAKAQRRLNEDVMCARELICYLDKYIRTYRKGFGLYFKHFSRFKGISNKGERFSDCGQQMALFINSLDKKDAKRPSQCKRENFLKMSETMYQVCSGLNLTEKQIVCKLTVSGFDDYCDPTWCAEALAVQERKAKENWSEVQDVMGTAINTLFIESQPAI